MVLLGFGCAAGSSDYANERTADILAAETWADAESSNRQAGVGISIEANEDGVAASDGSPCRGVWESVAQMTGWNPRDLARWQMLLRNAWVVGWERRLEDLAFEVDTIRADTQVLEVTREAIAALEEMAAAGTVSAEARRIAAARYREAHLRHLAALDARSDLGEHRRRHPGEAARDLVVEAGYEMPGGLLEDLQESVWGRLDAAAEGLHVEVLAAIAAIEHRLNSSDEDDTSYRYPPDWAPDESSDIRYEASNDPRRSGLAAQMYPYRDQAGEPFRSFYDQVAEAKAMVTDIAAGTSLACTSRP